jgi:hypothetical protein|tara:strand:+ start:53 stop:247 length:195 start_codon:yes stop_codon:yes gene_type:complete
MKFGEIPALSRNGNSVSWLSSQLNSESGQAIDAPNHVTLEDFRVGSNDVTRRSSVFSSIDRRVL